MDFQPDLALEAFRGEVADFFAAALPADLANDMVNFAHHVVSPPAEHRRWQAVLHERGWAAPGWASDHGGAGFSVEEQLVFDEERVRAGAPLQDGFAQGLIGPVLNAFATPAQWQEHVPPILRGERMWCQGFSEPGSGSDLASLRTRAERRGDHYVVNGQKIWTSYAHQADWIFLLVRTGTEGPKQAGISMLLVDMKAPGITVRPIVSIDGRHHLNETFFDNVEVPVGNRIGEEGQGWAITKFLLNNEHASTADLPSLNEYLRAMKRIAAEGRLGGRALAERPEYRLQIARFDAELKALGMMVQRTAALHGDQGHFAHAMGSMLKLKGTDLQQRMTAFLVELLGEEGAVSDPHAEGGAGAICQDMFFRRASTIYGGANEIQRGIIARLLFGL